MGSDVKRVVTKVDVIEEEVGATKKLLEKTNQRVEKVQQIEYDVAKKNAGGTAERITRRRKTIENDVAEKD